MTEAAIEIGPASVDDAPDILEIQKLAFESEARLYDDWSLPPLVQTLESLLGDFRHWRYLKASLGDRIVGAGRARMTGDVCEIGRLSVHPDCQGHGIGRALLRAAEQLFPNAQRYELFTGIKSVPNLRLYERAGYARAGMRRLNARVEFVVLEKRAR